MVSLKSLGRMSLKKAGKALSKDPGAAKEVEILSSIFEKCTELSKSGRYDELLGLLDDAIDRFPGNMDLAEGKIWALCALNYYDECLAFCDRLLEKSKDKRITRWRKVAEKRMRESEKKEL